MKKTTCNVATGDFWHPTLHEVAGYKTDIPGLVVHKEIHKTKSGIIELYDNSWNVTHQKSGLALRQLFKRRKDAVAFAEEIRDSLPYGVDWTATRMQIRLSMTREQRKRHLAKRKIIAEKYNRWRY